MTKNQLIVQNTIVSFTRIEQRDFIFLTDIARNKNPDEPKDVGKNWLRIRSTNMFLGLWEKINDPNFKGAEFEPFKTVEQLAAHPFWRVSAQSSSGKTLRNLVTASNQTAIHQLRSLLGAPEIKKLQ